MTEPLAVSIVEAARLSGVGRSTIYMQISQGQLKAVKVGSRTLIKVSDLRDWLNAKKEV